TERDLDREEGAAFGSLRQRDAAAVQRDEFARDGQPETRAVGRAARPPLQLAKALEDDLALGRRHPGPAVGDLQQGSASFGPERAPYLPALWRELERIGQQVENHPLKLVRIHLRGQGVRRLDRMGDALLACENLEV